LDGFKNKKPPFQYDLGGFEFAWCCFSRPERTNIELCNWSIAIPSIYRV